MSAALKELTGNTPLTAARAAQLIAKTRTRALKLFGKCAEADPRLAKRTLELYEALEERIRLRALLPSAE